MNEKPFVLPIKTPLGYYIYEISRNEIIRVGKELYDCVQHKLHNVSFPSEYAVTDKGEQEYAELSDCGYLQPNVLNEIRHPQTDQVELFLDRGLQQLTLQVTQDCNFRCSYCVYSGNNDANQRSHSRNVMSFDLAKKLLTFTGSIL